MISVTSDPNLNIGIFGRENKFYHFFLINSKNECLSRDLSSSLTYSTRRDVLPGGAFSHSPSLLAPPFLPKPRRASEMGKWVQPIFVFETASRSWDGAAGFDKGAAWRIPGAVPG